jgi:hypothetical protein
MHKQFTVCPYQPSDYLAMAELANAVALYERAGMRVRHRTLVYRKLLRGAFEEDATLSDR